MPLPLVDLARFDLSRTVIPKSDIYRVLRHGGTFQLLDGILHFDPQDDVIIGFREVRIDEWWTRDHIPGRPLMPGVLMVEAATQLGCFDFFRRRPEVAVTFVGFAGVDATRFRAPVEPPCRLVLAARGEKARASGTRVLFTYVIQGTVNGKIVFDTSVTGMQM